MSIKVIIERKVSHEGRGQVEELLKDLRIKAVRQAGYVTGETLFSVDDPSEHVVISTWESLRAWKAWEKNRERAKIEDKIEELLEYRSKTSVYETSLRE